FYKIQECRIAKFIFNPQSAESPDVILYTAPSESEKKELIEKYQLDEHTLNSIFDPDELARIEFEEKHCAIVYKRPKNYSSEDNYFFKVNSAGLFIFHEVLIIISPENVYVNDFKNFKNIRTIQDFFLKIFGNGITHFLEHLRIINNISSELENKINKSMENKYLINLYTLEKSLVYYFNAISSNASVLDKLRIYSKKLFFEEHNLEYLDDLIIENNQCMKQAEILSNILAGLLGANASIVSNNLNVLMKNLNAVVLAIMIPSFFAGVGGMSELTYLFGKKWSLIAYPVFLILMLVLAIFTFYLVKKSERH
ncbi:magnesium transporter CorA family protein, partial [candidate division WOR-3 bacterium]|nr:magnesium transporter CorA family protein [candidate division WOR-3 bacterium]